MKRSGKSTQAEMLGGLNWTHDRTKDVFLDRFAIQDASYNLEWFDGKLAEGKVVFNGTSFPIDYSVDTSKDTTCVVVFDEEGKGVVYHRQNTRLYQEKDINNFTIDELASGVFGYDKVLYSTPHLILNEVKALKNKVIKTNGDGTFTIGKTLVKTNASYRCGGTCEVVIVVNNKGEGVVYFK